MTNWLINSQPSGSRNVDPITFTEEYIRGIHYLHYDALVVRAVVARNEFKRMLVDNDSSVNVIFSSDCITPKEVIRLAVTMGEEPLATHTFKEFLVVDKRNALRKVEKKEVNTTILDVEMVEASEEAKITVDVTIEEAMPSEDVDPRVTGADSQTSSVEELENFRPDPEDLTIRLQIGKTSAQNPKSP
ncbi:Uncharacterized protein Adt_06133 [Abeliophyllum distichum]|uniref:Uncharacterized protein n=1 Tax=Abeliophyllum distichum TaxID=126358 RepID=A0ABD1V626_9LAMI